MAIRRKTLLSWIGTAGALAIAYRRVGQSQARTRDALKPQGRASPRLEPVVDRGTGRNADAPQDIPARGWWQVVKRVAAKFSENELMSEAAGCTFYALLSLFPAITAIVSIYGLFADRSAIEQQLDSLSSVLPSGGVEIIRDQVHRLTQSPATGLGVGAVVGLLTAMWSANAGTKAMFSALNDVYGEKEKRSFVTLTATSLSFTVGGILVVLLGIALIAIVPIALQTIGLGGTADSAARVLRWPLVLGALVVALALLYRYGPSRRPARWKWVTWGGVFGAIAWIGLSIGFSWYVAHFGSYNKTYGSLGAVIGFMTWIWLSTTVLLVGAQINAELEVQTGRDSTVDGNKPLGTRGAASADMVANEA